MHISDRLHMVADMIQPGNCLADVGCDHGYLSIWLVRKKQFQKAIAMDLRSGPLAKAEENIRFFHCEHVIETRLSDGLFALKPGEADTICCAGMGGELMSGILARGADCVQEAEQLVLQPQSDPQLVRAQVQKAGFAIAAEHTCKEDGKYYTVMRAVKGKQDYDAVRLLYGEAGIHKDLAMQKEYLEQELLKKLQMIAQLQASDTVPAKERLKTALPEKDMLAEAIRQIEAESLRREK